MNNSNTKVINENDFQLSEKETSDLWISLTNNQIKWNEETRDFVYKKIRSLYIDWLSKRREVLMYNYKYIGSLDDKGDIPPIHDDEFFL